MLKGISNGLSQIANKGNLMFENSTATRVELTTKYELQLEKTVNIFMYLKSAFNIIMSPNPENQNLTFSV